SIQADFDSVDIVTNDDVRFGPKGERRTIVGVQGTNGSYIAIGASSDKPDGGKVFAITDISIQRDIINRGNIEAKCSIDVIEGDRVACVHGNVAAQNYIGSGGQIDVVRHANLAVDFRFTGRINTKVAQTLLATN